MMFTYEIFDVIFKSFKEFVDGKLKNVIGISQKYMAGRYEVMLFLCSKYDIGMDAMTEKLNLLKSDFSNELEGWFDFELCTGLIDYDIKMDLFYSESEKEKQTHEHFVSLAIN